MRLRGVRFANEPTAKRATDSESPDRSKVSPARNVRALVPSFLIRLLTRIRSFTANANLPSGIEHKVIKYEREQLHKVQF